MSVHDELDAIEAGVTDLLHEHGLAVQGWRFEWDRATQRAGSCNYRKKKITMSRLVFGHSAEARARWRNTALHEIAHALVPLGSAHGPEWRRVARAIGCDARRCHSYETPPRAIVGKCTPGCPSDTQRDRARFPKPGSVYVCRTCRARVSWMARDEMSVVLSALRPDCDDVKNDRTRNPVGRSATNKETSTMSETTKEVAKATAPKPGRGFTVVELRTPHQSEIVKASTKGLPAGTLKFEDRWVTVKNENAQAVVDKVIANGKSVGIFDRRVLDYFTAVILLSNDKLTDSRSSLHQRLIGVGRGVKDFRFEMKQDGTLLVHVGKKLLGTQKDAMAALDADQLKAAPVTRDSVSGEAAAKIEDIAKAKAEAKALKEWEAADEATRGARPNTDTLDAKNAAYNAKQAKKAADADERRQVEPNFKAANGTAKKSSTRKAS